MNYGSLGCPLGDGDENYHICDENYHINEFHCLSAGRDTGYYIYTTDKLRKNII